MQLAAPVVANAQYEAPASYYAGIRAVVEVAKQFTPDSWNAATPCPEWRAADLADHLRCVADDYHEYLDQPPVSRLSRLMATGAFAQSIARKLARQNSAELAALPYVAPAQHITEFARSATHYAARIGSYRPADAHAVLAAWLAGIPHWSPARGGDPWLAVLGASGRVPD